jgi:hypothetical protein
MSGDPVFIGGLDRTGKTPMRIAIEAHASIAISRRAELWTHHRRGTGRLAHDGRARRAVEQLLRDPHVVKLVGDPARLLRDFLDGPRTEAELFALVGRQHAELAGRARWGDQTALIERHAPEILNAYSGARFVHMIRDPRDRFAEALGSGGVGPGGAGAAIERWLESVALAERHSASSPDRYLVVRFEDLALHPHVTLRRVLEFIGEPVAQDAGVASADVLARTIGVHRSLPRRTTALFETYCSEAMRRHGYEPTASPLTTAERMSMALLDRPVAAATSAALRLGAGLASRWRGGGSPLSAERR